MSEHRLPAPDDWYLRALRWEVDTAPAARVTAVARAAAARGELPPELVELLAEADRRYPEATHPERYAVVTIGPEPVDDPDPETAELLARMVEAPEPLEVAPARKGGRKRGRRSPLRVVEGGGDGSGGGAGGGDGGEGDPGPDVPGPALPVRGQWRYSTGEHRRWPRGVYGREGGERAAWRLYAPLPHVRARLSMRTGRGGHVFILSATPEGRAELVDGEALRDGSWAQRLDLVLSDDDRVMRAASTAIRAVAADAPAPEPVARWEAGRLVLPPVEVLPPGYLAAAGAEGDAREAWREVARLAASSGAENLALNLGASYAAPYPAALVRPVSFALAGIGAPRTGKTTNAGAAAGWWGAPGLVMPALSESHIAAGDQLAALGCLPWFRDEVHAADWRPGDWKRHFMRSLNGAGRRRSSATGSGAVSATAQWWGVQFLTGNLDPRYGAVDGVQARVVTLNDPHQPDASTADRVAELVAGAYGWPARWQLAEHPEPRRFRELAEAARAELLDGRQLDGSAGTVAWSLALCIAGAECAGALVDVPELRAAAVRSARRALDTLADTVADAPASFADRLLDAVWDDVAAHPGLYPRRADYAAMRRGDRDVPAARDVRGFRHEDGRVSVARAWYAELRELLDFDPDAGCDELRSRGLLTAKGNRGGGRQHLVRFPQAGSDRFYTFHARPEPPEGEGGDVERQGEGPGPEPAEVEHPEPAPPAAEPLPLDGPASSPTSAPQCPSEAPEAPAGGDRPRDRSAGATAPRGAGGAAVSSAPPAAVAVVEGGRLAVLHPEAGGGRWEYRPAEVAGELVELLDAAVEVVPAGPLVVLVAEGDHERAKLPARPPRRGRLPAVFRRAMAAGWHRPGHPGEAPRVMAATRMEREGRAGMVRLVPLAWLGPDDWPRCGPDDAGDAADLAGRLVIFRELLGWDLDGTPAATGVRVFRDLSRRPRHRVDWRPEGVEAWPRPPVWGHWPDVPVELPAEATHVHAWDAVRCHLSAIREARLAPGELVHQPAGRPFSPKLAGFWRIRVPEWPRGDLPAPVPRGTPGELAWVTSAVVELYAEALGEAPEVVEAWVAERHSIPGQRRFAEHLAGALRAADAGGDVPPEVVRGVKRLYQSMHGKLRSADQGTATRPDWGYAIYDQAWCTLLRKVYAGAGMLPLPSKVTGGRRRYTARPAAPVEIREVDTVIYAGGAEAEPPESFTVGEQLGDYRLKVTETVETWREVTPRG